MKKPVAKRPRTGLQRGFDSLTQDADSEKVNEVIRRLTGKSASYPAERPAPPTPPPVEAPARQVSTRAKTTVVNTTTVKNTPVSIDSNYYKIPNDVSDVLATMQTPAEQAVYHRLFRLSYGYNQDVCRVGMHALSRAMNISSKKTIAKAIAGLIEKQHIAIAQEAAGDVRGTWYRVFLPEDIASANHPTNIKNTTVHSTTVKNSTVIVANGGIHSTTVKNTRVEQPIETHDENSTGIKNTAVIFTPITTSLNNTLSLSAIVDQFYELLGQ